MIALTISSFYIKYTMLNLDIWALMNTYEHPDGWLETKYTVTIIPLLQTINKP